MKIQFWSIGKENDKLLDDAVDEFSGRVANYFPLTWNNVPSARGAGSDISSRRKKEGESVLKSLSDGDYLVVLDEGGKSLTSEKLATFMSDRANERTKKLVFLIGGAFGVDEAVLQRANFTWSLSSLTFPHRLVRLILAEQVYRACTILRNEKYHHR